MRQNPPRIVTASQEYPKSAGWSEAGIPTTVRQPQKERRPESHRAMTGIEATSRFPFEKQVINADAHGDGQAACGGIEIGLIVVAAVSEMSENVESASRAGLPAGTQW